MALFQNAVLNKYLKNQNKDAISKAYKKFVAHFHIASIQENIRNSKEEQYQEGFLRELFVNVLGYTLNPQPNYNLTTELKNERGAKKADGAILKGDTALAVIELKGTNTKDLEKVRQQAFDYKANQTECVYVITSNFEKLRFYINNAVDYEEFSLFELMPEQFALLYLCLHKDNLLSNLPLKIKEESVVENESITKKFYSDYSVFKRELYQYLVKLNMNNEVFSTEISNEDAEIRTKKIKQTLFKKSQTLIDRFLFVFFAEDRELLPPNSTFKILEQWDKLKELDAYEPLYSRFKKYFGYLDTGRKGTDKTAEIFAYNGGLFKPDTILDSLLIDDELLYKHTKKLSHYDFDSQVDVNILGHIFENSLNEIESVNAEIEGNDFDKQTSKRKKDGVFYTPKYITKYIVDNTIGKLCNEKKEELNIIEEDYQKNRKGRDKEKVKILKENLDKYREWLLKITICDPACGSGAFLNQALDFLIKEHQYIDELNTSLLGGFLVFPDIENTVLEHNIFGVDLNEESVEIAKLSLWLRTAQPRRKLNSLSNNIKCGNSLIDDVTIAGDKAFNWQTEFPIVFVEKEKKPFHITWVTHNSRTSQRMIDHKVKKGDAFWLEDENEFVVAETIKEIVEQDGLNVMAFNSCGDHIHLLLVCEEEEIPNIVRKLKGKSSQKLKEYLQLPKEEQFTLWAQKYSITYIESEEKLWNTVEYIRNNRMKHELSVASSNKRLQNSSTSNYSPTSNKGTRSTSNMGSHPTSNKGSHPTSNKGLQPLVTITDSDTMQQSYEHVFRTEYKGGFDVVIGNPPYVQLSKLSSTTSYEKAFLINKYGTSAGRLNTYILFIHLLGFISKRNSYNGYIIPNTILTQEYYVDTRKFILRQMNLFEIVTYPYMPFKDAVVESVTLFFKCNSEINKIEVKEQTPFDTIKIKDIYKSKIENAHKFTFEVNGNLISDKIDSFNYTSLDEFVTINQAIALKGDKTLSVKDIYDDSYYKLIDGMHISKYNINWGGDYLEYDINRIHSCKRKDIFQTEEKLFFRRVSSNLIFTYDNSKYFALNTLIVVNKKQTSKYELKTLLSVLNSKLINHYYSKKYKSTKTVFSEIQARTVSLLPIALMSVEEQAYLISRADKMLLFNKELQEIKSKFQRILQRKFDLGSLPKKLQDWYLLSYKDFIKELGSKKIKLTLSDEAEWEEYFLNEQQKAIAIKQQIENTDKEIDQMVYKLYNLTDEEIAIVEQS